MQKKFNTSSRIIIFTILMALFGIITINIVYHLSLQNVIKERDEQIFALAFSVDNNFVHMKKDIMADLDYTLVQEEHSLLIKRMNEGEGDGFEKAFSDYYSRSHLFQDPLLEGIVILNDQDEQVYSLNANDLSTDYQYTLLQDEDGDDLYVLYDQYGKYSIGFEKKIPDQPYRYYVLIDVNELYDGIAPDSLTATHWIVLYDQGCGLLLQNHDNQDAWMILSEEEIMARNDGYTIILKNQRQGSKGAETYEYANYYGKVVPERIITLPRQMTKNGYLTIGISRDSSALYGKLNRARNIEIVCMFLLLISSIISTSHFQRSRARIRQYELILDAKDKEQVLLKLQMREKELEKALLESQMKNSISQLQPHFLYNALSSIREIVLDDPDNAADLLLDFTIFLRSCLKANSAEGLIPFEQEMNNIKAYVNIEKMRFGENKLTVLYDIQEQDFSIISLGVQPLVENAIRHGISKKRGKTGTVKIQTYRKNGHIHIIVEDNGTGFDVEAVRAAILSGERDSTGVSNLRMRYENQLRAKFTITSEVGVGTKVHIEIPQNMVMEFR